MSQIWARTGVIEDIRAWDSIKRGVEWVADLQCPVLARRGVKGSSGLVVYSSGYKLTRRDHLRKGAYRS